jgi:putative DNA primase/helicase
MLKLVKDYNPTSIKAFDAEPNLIACKNGIVDLETGKFYEHSKTHRCLLRCNVFYHPDASCERWKSFLKEIFEREDKDEQKKDIDWIQVAVGYSATGLTDEEYFVVCDGVGGKGKTKFLETLLYVFGDYAHKAHFDDFVTKEKWQSNDILQANAHLKGKRFVIAAEPNKQVKFNTALLKELTGGDTITGRFLYKNRFTFKPMNKLWFAVNYLLTIDEKDNAIWGRLKRRPFEHIFPEGVRDEGLGSKLMSEADVIFTNWIIPGAVDYFKNGFPKDPEICRNAAQAYREQNDKFSVFIKETFEKDTSARYQASTTWTLFEEWRKDKQECFDVNSKNFKQHMQKQGIRSSCHTNEGTFYIGIKKKSNRSDASDGIH